MLQNMHSYTHTCTHVHEHTYACTLSHTHMLAHKQALTVSPWPVGRRPRPPGAQAWHPPHHQGRTAQKSTRSSSRTQCVPGGSWIYQGSSAPGAGEGGAWPCKQQPLYTQVIQHLHYVIHTYMYVHTAYTVGMVTRYTQVHSTYMHSGTRKVP